MSDEEGNNRNDDKPSKEGKKKTLAGATHLLKAEALKRYALQDVESSDTADEGGQGSSRPPPEINDNEGNDKILEDSASLEKKPAEIREEEKSQTTYQLVDQRLSEALEGINNSNINTSDLGNMDSSTVS